MSKFISIPVINSASIEADTVANVRADEIIDVRVASQLDRRQRTEVKSLIILRNGGCMASSLTAQSIVDAIEEASL